MNDFHRKCPLCDATLEGVSFWRGTARCPTGHYRYQGCGPHAADAVLVLEGGDEHFRIETKLPESEEALRNRIKKLR